MIGSLMYVLSTWPIPKGYAFLAAGNSMTCDIVGTLDQATSLATPCFSGSLAIYYLLIIRFGWREQKVRRSAESMLLGVPILAGSSTAIAGLVLELYNPANWVCWIAPFPPGCSDNPQAELPCERGRHADLYRMVFSYILVWVVFVIVAVCFVLIFVHVRRLEQQGMSYEPTTSSNVEDRRRTQRFFELSLLKLPCMCSLFISHLSLAQLHVFFKCLAQLPSSIGVLVCMTIFFPLQGFFNCLIYFYRRDVSISTSVYRSLGLMSSSNSAVLNASRISDDGWMASSDDNGSNIEGRKTESQETAQNSPNIAQQEHAP